MTVLAKLCFSLSTGSGSLVSVSEVKQMFGGYLRRFLGGFVMHNVAVCPCLQALHKWLLATFNIANRIDKQS
ncbi:hypothetical protein [Moraxella boevrei]|uniref:hypothetical protein n=1 Tax=Faucicola boevrei TaxID=346665 RepID=UPI0037357917